MTKVGRMPRVLYVLHCAREGCGRVVTRNARWWTQRAECEGECGVVTGSL
jgi:hypothetical protein